MPAPLSIDAIEDAIQHADPKTRHQTLRAVTDLFMSSAPGLDDSKVGIFDNLFDSLLDDSELEGVLDVSKRMAPIGNAPPRLVRRLAEDDRIEVAGPILSQSPRLSETDLCEIAKAKGTEHLLAISARPGLTEPLTDILIERGNQDVARSVAKNVSAQLSRAGLEQLVRLAEHDNALSAGLSVRSDIPAERLQALLAKAAARAEQKLVGVAAAQRLVVSMQQSGGLAEAAVKNFALSRHYEAVVASLSLLANLKYDAVENLLLQADTGGLILTCKALGFDWNTTMEILKTSAERSGLSERDVNRAHADFMKLSKATADRILRFWHVRQSVA
ncbi:MAG TPA: DUF2336 domain-containing protein [Pseudolabrys sp.]|uniref:DUF2336 domain-containing protein n=1 Tax=Pseudolabrys sp. TaxID=1960880 RepID=UPI002DDD77AC|nr:DUF2336 domain-containing protein [Pseudolabrys sp.]HEV2630839.1 DUF2336 domain-containing protein [Pseudolabrys sp.]